MHNLMRKFLDGDEGGDERLREGRNRAGNASFCAVMFLLWLAMAVGLVADRLDLVIVPFAVFMTGCAMYLFFLVRNGAFESERPRARSGKRAVLAYAAGAIVYAAIQFLFRMRESRELTPTSIADSAIESAVGAVIWVTLFAALVRFLKKRSDRRNSEKM